VGDQRENIFPARRSRVARTRSSGIISPDITDDPIRHRSERLLHAQLGAVSRHAAQKPMVWSVARQLGKRWQHFAALKNTGHYDDRLEPADLIHIFQDTAFCDDICCHRMRFGIALYHHEA